MSHTYSVSLHHCVFTTWGRTEWLGPEVRERLFPYIVGVARSHGMTAVAVGGVSDHVHVLLAIPSTITVARALRLMKGSSSHWLRETFEHLREFRWQSGYGAFSIGASQVKRTAAYIGRQETHHRARSYEEELSTFLARHGMDPAHPNCRYLSEPAPRPPYRPLRDGATVAREFAPAH